ncbi:hypothetical protein [Nocardiopsis nanhaiensis]
MDNETSSFDPPPFYWSGLWFFMSVLSIGMVDIHFPPDLATVLIWVPICLVAFFGWRLRGHLKDEAEREAQDEAAAQEAADREWARRVGLADRTTHNTVNGSVNGTVIQGGDVHADRAPVEGHPSCRCGSAVSPAGNQK